jgi:hypothetical protein
MIFDIMSLRSAHAIIVALPLALATCHCYLSITVVYHGDLQASASSFGCSFICPYVESLYQWIFGIKLQQQRQVDGKKNETRRNKHTIITYARTQLMPLCKKEL